MPRWSNPRCGFTTAPVTLWPSILTIQACDQISFHGPSKLTGLSIDPATRLTVDPVIADITPVDVFPACGYRRPGNMSNHPTHVLDLNDPADVQTERYWHVVKRTVGEIFQGDVQVVEQVQNRLARQSKGTQEKFYKTDPYIVAADIARKLDGNAEAAA
jgi:hypothetical protein